MPNRGGLLEREPSQGGYQSGRTRSYASACKTNRPPARPRQTPDPILATQLETVRKEVFEQRKLIDMLLTLVDPEDVAAALELKQLTPRNSAMLEIARQNTKPEDVQDDEERPW